MITLDFNNRFNRELPADPDTRNVCRQVSGAAFSRVEPRRASKPQLVAFSKEAAALIGLTPEQCGSELFVDTFVGNHLLDGMDPYAMCYGGHQFGNWAGQLGDGRAINLGEVVHEGEHWALQLKGAGMTPYSRMADGLAVLRSSVREFLCSEAMHHLGVPTTRALSLALTGDQVERDMFYNGNPKMEPGAVVCRMAPSFVRFGNFQLFAGHGDVDTLRALTEHTLTHHFPHLGELNNDSINAMFEEVCQRTAEMIVQWMRVGFVHGVMNTDNMSILGLTIDYGPYGWLENYDPDWTPNTTDAQGKRYRFSNQPGIAQWNLYQLANALVALTGDGHALEHSIGRFVQHYRTGYDAMMSAKLGLDAFDPERDRKLFASLEEMLANVQPDMTLFYRRLADIPSGGEPPSPETFFADALYEPLSDEQARQLSEWLNTYRSRVAGQDDETRRSAMNAVNPKYVLRNYLAQEAIDLAEQGDFSRIHELLDTLRRPYDEQPDREVFAKKRPDWAKTKAGCSMLSCSS